MVKVALFYQGQLGPLAESYIVDIETRGLLASFLSDWGGNSSVWDDDQMRR